MSEKALLVMDMPENCVDCILCFEIDEGTEACCTIVREQDNEDKFREIKEDYCQCKPDWCPLKPMPEKRKADVIPLSPLLKETLSEYSKGWNACIDEITEGKS